MVSTVAARPSGPSRLDRVEVDGDERRRPVVDVDDVGRPVEVLAELQGAAAEKGEADEVVGGEPAGRIVEVAAPEEAQVVEEVDGDVAPGDDRLERRRPTPRPRRGGRRAASGGA